MALDKNIFSVENNERTIDSFKNRLQQGGARPNLFEVSLAFPEEVEVNEDVKKDDFRMLIKGAQLPASNVAEVVVPFRGRQLKVAGDRRFDPWTITVINDGDFLLREAFERWANFIIKVTDGSGTIEPRRYMADLTVSQLGRSPIQSQNASGVENASKLSVLRSYVMKGCWPSNVSALDLSYDTQDTIEEFQVTFQVQYWEAYDAGGNNSIV